MAHDQARRIVFLAVAALVLTTASSTPAAQPKQPATRLDDKAFFRPELSIRTAHVPLADALPGLTNRAGWESYLTLKGDDPRRPRTRAWIDPLSGAATNLLEAFPLIPGRGLGNRVTLASLGSDLGRA